jgi:RES domain-containing protein
MQDFTIGMMQVIRIVPAGDVLNAEETCWRLDACDSLCEPLGGVGALRHGSRSEKQWYTVVATVIADESKLPLQIVVKRSAS